MTDSAYSNEEQNCLWHRHMFETQGMVIYSITWLKVVQFSNSVISPRLHGAILYMLSILHFLAWGINYPVATQDFRGDPNS